MQIYINGVKATKDDLDELKRRVGNGQECVVDVHMTKAQNIAIVTA